MSFEKGGRADKQGNVYENRCLAWILIRLVAEEITSVVVEPVEEKSNISSSCIQHKSKCWVHVKFPLLVYSGTTLFCLQYHKDPKC